MTTKETLSLLMVTILILWGTHSTFAAQQIVNGGFETAFTGWIVTGNVITTDLQGVSEGSRAAAFNFGNTAGDGVLSQGFPTVVGARYTLTFDYGVFGAPNQQSLRVELLGTGTLLDCIITSNGAWPNVIATFHFAFVADSGVTTLRFTDSTPIGPSLSADFMLDRVSVIAVSVGGTVSGMTPTRVTCLNQTTAQTVVIEDGARAWDCEAAGLGVSSGQRIRQTILGTAD